MSNNKKKGIWGKWIYWFVFAVAVIMVFKTVDSFAAIKVAISNLLKTIAPFTMGILIAGLLYVPASKTEKLIKKPNQGFLNKIARPVSIMITYTLTIFLIILASKIIIPTVKESVTDLVNNNLQGYYNDAIKQINDIPDNDFITKDELKDTVGNAKNYIREHISIENLIGYVKGVINIAAGIFDFFVAVILSVYILMEREAIVKYAKKALRALVKNDEKYECVCKYVKLSTDVFFKFLGGQIIDAIVVGIITAVAMTVMHVKYAGLLGFVIGLFNLIPYFGAIFAIGIAILITVFTGGLVQAIWMAVVIIVLQQIDANIINPRIIGSSLEISPILVIFAVTVGGAYFGILGMFLGVPVAAVIKIILTDVIEYENKLYDEEKKKPKKKTTTTMKIKKTVIGEEEI